MIYGKKRGLYLTASKARSSLACVFFICKADGLSLIIAESIVTLPYVGFMESEVSEKHGHVPVFDRISGGFQQN